MANSIVPDQNAQIFMFLLLLSVYNLTQVLPNPSPAFANSVDPDQLASEEANWSGSALFVIKYIVCEFVSIIWIQ